MTALDRILQRRQARPISSTSIDALLKPSNDGKYSYANGCKHGIVAIGTKHAHSLEFFGAGRAIHGTAGQYSYPNLLSDSWTGNSFANANGPEATENVDIAIN